MRNHLNMPFHMHANRNKFGENLCNMNKDADSVHNAKPLPKLTQHSISTALND